mmetsp:Transcript_112264/g.322731  ORF Transcript_112264/g.322731 Transcript_112264/m.322731 type:complete len:558 (+) Transcript_112264:89-1762(+)
MGQARSSQVCGASGRRAAAPAGNTLVTVDKVAGRGSLPISRRYTSSRPLESDYIIEPKILGSGMSGPVRLAIGKNDGRKYAVKSFKKTGLSAKHREELKSEAEIYLSLDHPHVAHLEMVFETEEELHLVMEYMAGGELYDRLAERRQYSEESAAEATHQMLLAVAYLHAHRIAHRDLKLENFLYERKDTNHLKLIDFGFAKFNEKSTKMSQACGSIHYVAPEVLAHAYTEKADMWSMGVIVYMLLTGSPPFHGTDEEVLRKVKAGNVHWSSRFQKLSPQAKDFVRSLIVVDPTERMSAQQALQHPWITQRRRSELTLLENDTLESLRAFSRTSQFRRNVLSMMAWSLSAEDRSELRKQFLSIDKDKGGTISLKEFKEVLAKRFNVCGAEAEEIFNSLDTDKNDEIEYSEFLAAALLGHVKIHEDVLRRTFVRFDVDGDGKIDCQELRSVLGDTFSQKDIEEVLREADTSGDGKLDYEEFLAYFHRPEGLEQASRAKRRQHTEKLGLVIDNLIAAADGSPLPPARAGGGMVRHKTAPIAGRPLPVLLSNIRAGLRSKK